eukprot:107834-Prymnesium_polylepis.1
MCRWGDWSPKACRVSSRKDSRAVANRRRPSHRVEIGRRDPDGRVRVLDHHHVVALRVGVLARLRTRATH